MREVNEIGMKDHEKNDSLRSALCCLPALDVVPSSDVTKVFFILAGNICLILVDNMHFFQCHHPTLWTFMKGLAKDMQMQLTPY